MSIHFKWRNHFYNLVFDIQLLDNWVFALGGYSSDCRPCRLEFDLGVCLRVLGRSLGTILHKADLRNQIQLGFDISLFNISQNRGLQKLSRCHFGKVRDSCLSLDAFWSIDFHVLVSSVWEVGGNWVLAYFLLFLMQFFLYLESPLRKDVSAAGARGDKVVDLEDFFALASGSVSSGFVGAEEFFARASQRIGAGEAFCASVANRCALLGESGLRVELLSLGTDELAVLHSNSESRLELCICFEVVVVQFPQVLVFANFQRRLGNGVKWNEIALGVGEVLRLAHQRGCPQSSGTSSRLTRDVPVVVLVLEESPAR